VRAASKHAGTRTDGHDEDKKMLSALYANAPKTFF